MLRRLGRLLSTAALFALCGLTLAGLSSPPASAAEFTSPTSEIAKRSAPAPNTGQRTDALVQTPATGTCQNQAIGISQLCQAGHGLSGLVGSAVGGATSKIVGAGANAVLAGVSEWVAGGAAWLLRQVGSVMTATTRPDLSARWFTDHYKVMSALAAVMLLPLLMASVIHAVARQDLSILFRAALIKLPTVLLFTAVVVQVVQLSLTAVDAMSSAVSGVAGSDLQGFMTGVAAALGSPASGQGVPLFVAFIGSLVVAFGAFVLWLELVVRASAIYVAVLFLPLGMAGLVWQTTSHWCRRLGETIAALVLAKLVIVAVLSLALGALSGEGGPVGFNGVVAGGALLLLATYVPFAILRLIPAFEAGAVAHLEGSMRHSLTAMPFKPAAQIALSGALATQASGAGALEASAEIPVHQGLPEPPGMSGVRPSPRGSGDGAVSDVNTQSSTVYPNADRYPNGREPQEAWVPPPESEDGG